MKKIKEYYTKNNISISGDLSRLKILIERYFIIKVK
jgi:hypothetical protein